MDVEEKRERTNAAARRYRARHIEQIREKRRELYQTTNGRLRAVLKYHANLEEARKRHRESQARWRAKNRAHVRRYNREYGRKRIITDKRREQARLAMQRRYALKPEWFAIYRRTRLAYDRKWRVKNTAKLREQRRKWREKNPHAARRAKARRRGAAGHFAEKDIRAIYLRQCGFCVGCGHSIARGYDIDHIVPISKGGSSWPRNLQLLCPTCNRRKGARI